MPEQDETRQLPATDARTSATTRLAAHGRDGATEAGPPGPSRLAPSEGEVVLGRYRLERRIGRGGHGTVWEALDERLERRVAVKVIVAGEGGVGPRAEREGRVAARLNHPGIVALYELDSEGDCVYLVSELVQGRTMAELGGAGALSDHDVARIGLALCSALEHAHERGVVHRDVKPQNVIVVAEPAAGEGFAKLTDFGVAHLRDDETLTRTGDVVGTLAYMAPEQAEGGQVGPAADVYSLALLLYEGWTGTGSAGVVAARLAGRPVAPIRRLRRDLPAGLCHAIDAALDPRPDARPALAELRAELDAALYALSEEGGLVEPATRRRFGIPSAAAVASRPLPAPPGWMLRLAAGVAAGALVVAGLEALGAPALPFPPLMAGAAVAGLVALLPRIGWMLAALGVVGWLGSPDAGLQGTALVVACALAPVPILLPRAGLLWSVPALAPLLGAAGLAPLFLAIAGLASTAWRRVGLAIAGFGWLAAAEILAGRVLLFGPADDVVERTAFEQSGLTAAREVVLRELISPALLPGLAWALLALAFGLAVRGRSLALDLLGAVVWAVALVAVHRWLAELLAADGAGGDPRGVVAGAVLGALAGVIAVGAGLRGGRWRRPSYVG